MKLEYEISPLPISIQRMILEKSLEFLIDKSDRKYDAFLCNIVKGIILDLIRDGIIENRTYTIRETSIILLNFDYTLIHIIENSIIYNILTLLIPSFNKNNIQEHTDDEFIVKSIIWFNEPLHNYIPTEILTKLSSSEKEYNLYLKFTNPMNYYRYKFIEKLIKELEECK